MSGMYKNFINKYQVSKTLRFELKPQGKTQYYIEKDGILTEGQYRAESYKKVKKIIDEYHKHYIDKALCEVILDGIEDYYLLYIKPSKESKEIELMKLLETKLRKQIVQQLKKPREYKKLFKKELIKEILPEFVGDDEEKINLIREFDDFTTYFVGFHQNRENMYTDEEKSTAVAYRVINQNLPKYIDNFQILKKASDTALFGQVEKIENELQELLEEQSLVDFFDIRNYGNFLTQKGIDKYNQLIGGKTVDERTKIKGLNEYINLYNQKADKSSKIGKMKPLYKQILSDRKSISFIPEAFETDQDVLNAISDFYQQVEESLSAMNGLLKKIKEFNSRGIFLKNDASLQDISQKAFGQWDYIKVCVESRYDDEQPQKKKEKYEKYLEKRKKELKKIKSYSIEDIEQLTKDSETLKSYFSGEEREALWSKLQDSYSSIEPMLMEEYQVSKTLSQDTVAVEKIKVFLDAVKAFQRFILPLSGSGLEAGKDERFYGEYAILLDDIDVITPLYNKVRNYMTKKPYSTEKVKLTFGNSTLMNGWDLNKEKDNTAVILLKDEKYFIGIMSRGNNKIFESLESSDKENCYRKMEYKLIPNPYMMFPKVFLPKKDINKFAPSKELLANYEKDTHVKGENFNLKDCHKLINFFKNSIEKHPDWSKFNFKFSNTETYNDISEFYKEVADQGYKITYKNIDTEYIDSLIEEGKLYLFQIYNKDFSEYSTGRKNLHTLYWQQVFSEENLKDVVYKLNGQAEVFYRKASINEEGIIKHPANQKIKNKNTRNEKKESLFKYEIIKDRRFTVDKLQFHVPVTMNFKAQGRPWINEEVKHAIRKNPEPYVIGIDRGERNLLYLCVIDNKGRIVKQQSLNIISNAKDNTVYETDYHALLNKKEEERAKARKDWKSIENIKELKEGYLSQAIHVITNLMVEYNAVLVLEDLNMGFMRGRQKVEKQVYQKFEKMLIDNLNYLVDKKTDPNQNGGLLKAYQLSNKFESFQKLGKQSGFLFYTQAWNTSKIDPATGFVNLFDTRYKNIESSQKFWNAFDSIKFNSKENYFEFAFDYNNFSNKVGRTKADWTVCSYGTRIRTFRNPEKNNQWDNIEVDLTKEFIELFDKYGIEYQNGNIREQIASVNEKKFHETMMGLMKLLLQIRNSLTGTEIDYLISPVRNKNNTFYDSRKAKSELPQDADANGAYNIARKGLMIIERIKNTPEDELKKVNLAISNNDWLIYAQEQAK